MKSYFKPTVPFLMAGSLVVLFFTAVGGCSDIGSSHVTLNTGGGGNGGDKPNTINVGTFTPPPEMDSGTAAVKGSVSIEAGGSRDTSTTPATGSDDSKDARAVSSTDLGTAVALTNDAGTRTDGSPAVTVKGECPDLDGNGVLDCKETLLINADFKTSVMSWTAESNAMATFSSDDGDGNAVSGSLVATNANQGDTAGSAMTGARQCLNVTGGSIYDLAAQVFLPTGTAQTNVLAGLNIQFFGTTGCAGDAGGVYMSPLIDVPGQWQGVQGIVATPAGVKSMAVRLVVLKPFKQPPARAMFDNILIRAR